MKKSEMIYRLKKWFAIAKYTDDLYDTQHMCETMVKIVEDAGMLPPAINTDNEDIVLTLKDLGIGIGWENEE